MYVLPDDPGALDPRGFAMTIRQTTLGVAVAASDVLGAEFDGDIEVDFHGGQLPSSGGRAFALIRMRTARAVLKWRRTELLLGQDAPLIAPVDPVSLASVGSPLFSGAGNLWLWNPQVRLTIERPGRLSLALQGAVAAPGIAAPVGSFEVSSFDLAERSRRPFLQARVRGRWGDIPNASEAGVAVHTGWYAIGRDSLSRGYAAAIDVSMHVAPRIELRGELYDGKGTRSLGGGAIVQLFGSDGRLIRSRGGWLQANVHAHPTLDIGAGLGLDDPNDTDVAASARLKNVAAAAHAHWRPAAPLVFGLEYRRIATSYVTETYANHHVNLAFGFEF
jgi:hypothetical protein